MYGKQARKVVNFSQFINQKMKNPLSIKNLLLNKLKKNYPGINELILTINQEGTGSLNLDGVKTDYSHTDLSTMQFLAGQLPKNSQLSGARLHCIFNLDFLEIKVFYILEDQKLFKTLNL